MLKTKNKQKKRNTKQFKKQLNKMNNQNNPKMKTNNQKNHNENEFYIKADLVSTDINETNSIYYKNSKGKEFNIFGISAELYELRIAPYTKVLHTIMARAMMHQNIMIDGERYYKNESSKYTKANIENGFYTARIQLTKEGTEIVSTLCC